MSRCFPYPPPGFLKTNGESAVSKAGEERHKNNKERKERKKDRKHKEKSYRDNGMVKEKKHREHKRHKHERSKTKHIVGDRAERREDENEQMERSSLTEELGQPVGFQNFSDSFDSAHCRGKRPHDDSTCACGPSFHKKQRTCEADSTCGKGLWIRLPVLKDEQQESSNRASVGVLAALPQMGETASSLHSGEVGRHKAEARFKYGAEDLCPALPPMSSELSEPENLDWLFEKKHHTHDKERRKANEELGEGVSEVWSCACYLPSADLHVLPYVNPY
ncbi:uncharacterized protein LOC116261575 isoform X2 [Nymphaea colorata]|uniref:uncharacterized protein LOC116261575 isoform X2 n=1 Tax=Nymphaea colorata TaxID=210225 RepID=UPI00129ED1BB|nr:uncharacterized protein LOC116261575 isoform X2 [Nymphaea colorata]